MKGTDIKPGTAYAVGGEQWQHEMVAVAPSYKASTGRRSVVGYYSTAEGRAWLMLARSSMVGGIRPTVESLVAAGMAELEQMFRDHEDAPEGWSWEVKATNLIRQTWAEHEVFQARERERRELAQVRKEAVAAETTLRAENLRNRINALSCVLGITAKEYGYGPDTIAVARDGAKLDLDALATLVAAIEALAV